MACRSGCQWSGFRFAALCAPQVTHVLPFLSGVFCVAAFYTKIPQNCGCLQFSRDDMYECLARCSACVGAPQLRNVCSLQYFFITSESEESAFPVPFGDLITTTAARSSTPEPEGLRGLTITTVALHYSSRRNARDPTLLETGPKSTIDAQHVCYRVSNISNVYRSQQNIEPTKTISA